MKKRYKKRIYLVKAIIILLLSYLGVICVSFLYPGVMPKVDAIRTAYTKTTIEKFDYVETDGIERVFSISQRYSKNAISFEELKPHLDILTPGTIIISSHGKRVCALIPGMWKHTTIFLGSQEQSKKYFGENSEFYKLLEPHYTTKNEYLMIDASFRHNVAIRCVSTMANLREESTLRAFLCIEPKLNKKDNLAYICRSVNELGKKYDMTFDDSNSEEYYCTEFIIKALLPTGIQLEKHSKVFNRTITLPDDMVNNILENKILNLFTYKYCLVKETNDIKRLSINQFAQLSNDHLLN